MKRHLDAKDSAILATLRANGRASLTAIARQVGLSRSSAQERIARLERDGVILGYAAETREPGGATVEGYLLVSFGAGICGRQAAAIRRIDEVRRCVAVGGDADLIVHVVAADAAAFAHVRDRVAGMPEVQAVKSYLALPE